MSPLDFRLILETLDVEGAKQASALLWPHLPQPQTDAAVLASLHAARTASESVALKLRAYSHRWLLERDMPSLLPDHLKPSAERLYPKVVTAVGLCVGFSSPDLKPAGDLIRGAGEVVVEDCYADGREDPAYVKPRMMEAIVRERKALFGRWLKPSAT